MKTKRFVATMLVVVTCTALAVWPVREFKLFASMHVEDEWTYGSSILVKCLPKPPRGAETEYGPDYLFFPYDKSDFPEIKQWIAEIFIMERRLEYMQLLIILKRDDMYDNKALQEIRDVMKDNPNLLEDSKLSVIQNYYMYKGGVNPYKKHEIFYSEDLFIFPSYVPYNKEQFEVFIGIIPETVDVLARESGLSYSYVATGLSNYFELCYIIDGMAHMPGCTEVYMNKLDGGPILPSMLGDANCDGIVNIEDIMFVRNIIYGDEDARISEKGYTNLLFEDPISINSILLIRNVIFDVR